jgi:hypothetical protein
MEKRTEEASGKDAAKEAWTQAPPFPIAENMWELKIAVWSTCETKSSGEAAEIYASHGIPGFPCGQWKKQPDGSKLLVSKSHRCVTKAVYISLQSMWNRCGRGGSDGQRR